MNAWLSFRGSDSTSIASPVSLRSAHGALRDIQNYIMAYVGEAAPHASDSAPYIKIVTRFLTPMGFPNILHNRTLKVIQIKAKAEVLTGGLHRHWRALTHQPP